MASSKKQKVGSAKHEVIDYVAKIVPSEVAEAEVNWFYNDVGLPSEYFTALSSHSVSKHVLSLYAARIAAKANDRDLQFEAHETDGDPALYIARSNPDADSNPSRDTEKIIETKYLGEGCGGQIREGSYSLAAFRTTGAVGHLPLRLFFVQQEQFGTPDGTFLSYASLDFKHRAGPAEVEAYEQIVNAAIEKDACVVEYSINDAVQQLPENDKYNIRLLVAFKKSSTHSFFSSLPALYRKEGLYARMKRVDHFSNGVIVYKFNLSCKKNLCPDLRRTSEYLTRKIQHLHVLPSTWMSPLLEQFVLTPDEQSYIFSVVKFASQVWTVDLDLSAYFSSSAFAESAHESVARLVRKRMRRDTIYEERLIECVRKHLPILQRLYKDFRARLTPPSYEFEKLPLLTQESLRAEISKIHTDNTDLDYVILQSFLTFNASILKTNFFKTRKQALSYRFSPECLSQTYYPVRPFAFFMIVGSEFMGFHIRFEDIARGGIRLIKSANASAYNANFASLFDENFALAHTQQKKNKDIPEGGSKGTILLTLEQQDKGSSAFEKYIDALLDAILPNEEVVDLYGQEEILFLGPDENTADKMESAALRAKRRGAKFWKSFTTGKPQSLGGIPHDTYGMTTRGIHQFVLRLLEHYGEDEAKLTKFQTGGPDGDLGSNEIKISHDKTIGVVDGSGVLCDPEGLDRSELVRLATGRLMSCEYDKSKLGPLGFFVSVQDKDVTLPNGELVSNGMMFRNTFHLNPLAQADLFVPCGGRPEAVNSLNVTKLPKFRYIVEGANLFFTEDAREILSKSGVKLIKDASANKGGVTSSSMEVFAALLLTEEQHDQMMQVHDPDHPPQLYRDYVAATIKRIEENARLECAALIKESESSDTPMCRVTDDMSARINALAGKLRASPLYQDMKLRKKVVEEYTPECLLAAVGGIEKFLEQCPESYLKAIFGSFLASRYIYTYGFGASEFAFFDFITKFLGQ